MIKKFMMAIAGKSWSDAKCIAKRMMMHEERLNPEYAEAIRNAALVALKNHHAALYGQNLCNIEAVSRFLCK